MVRKAMSVVCIASILAGAAVGVIARLRTRKVCGREQANDEESRPEDAGQRDTATNPVGLESKGEQMVGLDTGGGDNKGVVDTEHHHGETASFPCANPTPGDAFSPGAVLIKTVNDSRRKGKTGRIRRSLAVASSSAADAKSTQNISFGDVMRSGSAGTGTEKVVGERDGREEVATFPVANPVPGSSFNAGSKLTRGPNGSRRKTAGRKSRGSLASASRSITPKESAASFFDASRKKSPGDALSLHAVNGADEKPEGTGKTASPKPLPTTNAAASVFETSNKDELSVSVNGVSGDEFKQDGGNKKAAVTQFTAASNSATASTAGAPLLNTTSSGASPEGQRLVSSVTTSGAKLDGSDDRTADTTSDTTSGTTQITIPTPAVPNNMSVRGICAPSFGTSTCGSSSDGEMSANELDSDDVKPDDTAPAATPTAPVAGSAASSSGDVTDLSPEPEEVLEERKDVPREEPVRPIQDSVC